VPAAGVMAYAYDASGRLITASYAGRGSIAFTHDAASNLTSVVSSGFSDGGGGGTITDWRAANNLPVDGTGDGADTAILADDGLPNLAKYAFGFAPRTLVAGDQPALRLTHAGGRDYLTLTYQRPDPKASDLTYTVQVSGDNGATWASGAGNTVDVSTTINNGVATVVVRDATAVGAPSLGRRIRLMIERRAQP
jgi:YD repeat-containing protein